MRANSCRSSSPISGVPCSHPKRSRLTGGLNRTSFTQEPLPVLKPTPAAGQQAAGYFQQIMTLLIKLTSDCDYYDANDSLLETIEGCHASDWYGPDSRTAKLHFFDADKAALALPVLSALPYVESACVMATQPAPQRGKGRR
jgi:hypothetical protein